MIDGSRDGVEGNENEYLMGMVANEVYNFWRGRVAISTKNT